MPAYVPVEAKPWKLRMGLRPLEAGRWLEVDAQRPAELALKRQLLDSPDSRRRVLACLEGTESRAAKLLDLVLADLESHHPGLVTVGAGGRLRDESTGLSFDPRAMHPVEAASRLVQEDLCLMVDLQGGWRLAAACVCFPSRWSLRDKLGQDVVSIHAPVPGYADELGQPTRAFFDRLSPDRPVWRLNWTVLPDPSLHQPDPFARSSPEGVEPQPAGLWFRVERQTLRRLSPAEVVFTIRTYVTALGELVDAHPEAGAALAVALTGVPEEVLRYKGWTHIAPRVVSWLASRGLSGPT